MIDPTAAILLPLALSFVAPGLAIAGIFLASIPIIIHFLNRRRFKTHRWAAMQYLLEALRRNRRRLKFENILLLTLRCAAILLAAAALARPMGCNDSATARMVGQTTRLHVIVLDNSASMSYQVDATNDRTCFERGRRLASELISHLSASHDAVAVIPAAASPEARALAPTYDLAAAGESLNAISQRFTRTDLPAALRRALEIGQAENTFTARRLYIITDSTLAAWQDPTVVEELRQLGPQLAAMYDIIHINAGEPTARNAAITNVRMLSGVATTRMGVDFAATPFSNPASQASIVWNRGGDVLGASGSLSLSPGMPEQALPSISFNAEGPAAITARLDPGDRLPADDQRSTALYVRSRLDVVIGEGNRGLTSLESPGTFLQIALAPAGTDTEAVKVDVSSDSEIARRPLAGRDAVILAAPAGLNSDDATQIRQYVEAGGTLIVFMGEGVNPDMCNRVLLPQKLIPGKIMGLTTTAEGQEPARLDFRPDAALHPLLRIFRGEQNSGLATTRVWSYARLELDPSLGAQRVLDFVSGEPAITLHTLGQGRVVFFASSADTRWTTLPAKPAFVALINEILLGTVNAGQRLDES